MADGGESGGWREGRLPRELHQASMMSYDIATVTRPA